MPNVVSGQNLGGAGGLTRAYLSWVDGSGATNLVTFSVVTSEDWDEGAQVTEHPVEQGPDVADHIRVSLPTCRLRVWSTNEPIDMASGSSVDQAVLSQQTMQMESVIWSQYPAAKIDYPDWNNPITARALAISAAGAGIGATFAATGNGQDELAGLAEAAAVVGAELLANLFLGAKAQTLEASTDAGLVPELNPNVGYIVQTWPAGVDYVYDLHQLLKSLKDAATLFTVVGSKSGPVPNMVIEHLSFHRGAETGTGEEIEIGLKQILIVTTQTVAVTPISNLSGGGGTSSTSLGAQTAQPAQTSIAAHLVDQLSN